MNTPKTLIFAMVGLGLWLSSCNKNSQIHDRFLGEYHGQMGFSNPLDTAHLIYEPATLLVEKESKKEFLISSPSHPDLLEPAVYLVEPSFSTSELHQVAVEATEGSYIGVAIFSENADSISVELTKGAFPNERSFNGSQ